MDDCDILNINNWFYKPAIQTHEFYDGSLKFKMEFRVYSSRPIVRSKNIIYVNEKKEFESPDFMECLKYCYERSCANKK